MDDGQKNFPKELPEPWYWTDQDLSEELYHELCAEHILKGVVVKTIARRQDLDDVLFKLENAENEYAVVHLTWSKTPETDPRWPVAQLYKTWDVVWKSRILPDAQEFD